MHELIHRGSVKDVYRLDDQALLFKFSNRYSIFDWGEMPDAIEGKGEALAKFSKSLFCKFETSSFWQENLFIKSDVAEGLRKNGLKTHQLNRDCKSNEIVVKEVPCPRSDLASYSKKPNDAFIPLEVIFRLGVPAGSSLLERMPGKYQANQFLDAAMIEFSTKWEARDRMLSSDEAMKLAGLDEREMKELVEITQCLAMALKNFFKQREITLWDGKVEWAFCDNGDKRGFMLVDSIGPDELRLTHSHISFSKEFLRSWYRKSDWFKSLKEAKEKFGDDFREHCPNPDKLPAQLCMDISKMYQALANTVDGNESVALLVKDLERWS